MRKISRAVVSGVTGFVGGALARRLSENGCEVFGLVRPGSRRSSLAHIANLRLIEWDGVSVDALTSQLSGVRPEVVYHAAAYGVQPGANDLEMLLSGNIHYTVNLLRAAASFSDCRFVHTGSCSEYGPIMEPHLLTEDAPTNPATVYGATKLASVQLVHTLARQIQVLAVTLRLFMTYGPGEGTNRLLPSMINSLIEGKPIELTPGEQVRDWLFIDDVVDAYLQAGTAAADAVAGKIFNVCTGAGVTVRRVAEIVAQLLGAPTELLRWGARAYRPFEPMWIVGDSRRLQSATEWRPRFSLVEGLTAALAPYQRRVCA